LLLKVLQAAQHCRVQKETQWVKCCCRCMWLRKQVLLPAA
jgi:hypothetical protein